MQQKAFTFSITIFGKNLHEAVNKAIKAGKSFYDMDIKVQTKDVHEYVKGRFETCPNCGDIDNQAGKEFNDDENGIWKIIICGACDCVYNHFYAPSNIEILKEF